ncbi:DUF6252 family protein [Mesonia sp.]|uniref:DUF6252 family protein n=1 Tax=Mesonia sp. TaxID=1960830 RepID=UPI001766B1D7|nr:DUF6252 family protein [Mesonia sp.]HIB36534.1 hypothetical protein [Mesonia sp.]HIO27272.1 hypothetical protein [Flavobacteriaceae bacterium]
MKNLTLLLLFALVAISCGDDIESNTPSIQGEVNGEFFRSSSSTAYINADESVTLTGETGLDKITLKTAALEIGEYALGNGSQNEAAYEVGMLSVYATGTNGDGLIEITRIQNNTVSGEFYFNAINGDTLNVNKGSFFDVPIVNGSPESQDCSDATLEVSDALNAYSSLEPTDEGYEEACNNYAEALQNKIDACGDAEGTLADLLAALDCTEEEPAGNVFDAVVNTEIYEYSNLSVEEVSNTISLNAVEPDQRNLTIAIPNDLTEGTYGYNQVTANGQMWEFEAVSGNLTTITPETVSLVISEHDVANNHISGSFTFTAVDNTDDTIEYEISGDFDVMY